MIFDSLNHAEIYRDVHPLFRRAFDVLRSGELPARPDGRYELEGDRLFAMVQRYATRPIEQGRWEAHRRYIDIQYIAEGQERIGHAMLQTLRVTEAYDEAKDVMFLEGEGSFLTASAGQFAVFYPHDAHMPSLAVQSPQQVLKIVFKVAVGE